MTTATDEFSARWVPTQADFDAFAELSGDDNPIHVDAEFSARTRFGRTVSHGMLLYSRLWALLRQRYPEHRHEMQALMFPNPAYPEEELELAFSPADTGEVAITVSRVADGAPVLVGQCRLEAGR
ncbi:MaoC/PaaZ C-terminal domain-containing protein [Stappia sp. WLB 29]|uniref:MaoC family dehydratase n=1 Tax=Stappia sp. WLB 29 TaxID=2925220 RepID=UPI0020C0D33F